MLTFCLSQLKAGALPKIPVTSNKMTDFSGFSGFSSASKQALAAKDAELRAMQAQMDEMAKVFNTLKWENTTQHIV